VLATGQWFLAKMLSTSLTNVLFAAGFVVRLKRGERIHDKPYDSRPVTENL
jgi:hypothetical protein